jgi:hypothetical protein
VLGRAAIRVHPVDGDNLAGIELAGIVNSDGRGMLVVSVSRRLGS